MNLIGIFKEKQLPTYEHYTGKKISILEIDKMTDSRAAADAQVFKFLYEGHDIQECETVYILCR